MAKTERLPERTFTPDEVCHEPVRLIHLYNTGGDQDIAICGVRQPSDWSLGLPPCPSFKAAGRTYCPYCFRPICPRCQRLA